MLNLKKEKNIFNLFFARILNNKKAKQCLAFLFILFDEVLRKVLLLLQQRR